MRLSLYASLLAYGVTAVNLQDVVAPENVEESQYLAQGYTYDYTSDLSQTYSSLSIQSSKIEKQDFAQVEDDPEESESSESDTSGFESGDEIKKVDCTPKKFPAA